MAYMYDFSDIFVESTWQLSLDWKPPKYETMLTGLINLLVLSVWNLPKQTTRKAAIILQLSSGYSGQRRAETAVTNEAMLQHKTCMNVGGRVWSINHGTEETPLLSSPDTSLGITWAKEAKEGNMVSQPTEGFLPVPLGRR